jgi:hypothetical protein
MKKEEDGVSGSRKSYLMKPGRHGCFFALFLPARIEVVSYWKFYFKIAVVVEFPGEWG